MSVCLLRRDLSIPSVNSAGKLCRSYFIFDFILSVATTDLLEAMLKTYTFYELK